MRTYKGIRSDLGKTIPEMAAMLGIKPNTYKSIENGRVRTPAEVHVKMAELGNIEFIRDLEIPKRK